MLRGLGIVLCATVALGAEGDDARERFTKELQSVYDYLPADVEQVYDRVFKRFCLGK